jgi:hypothetical protein
MPNTKNDPINTSSLARFQTRLTEEKNLSQLFKKSSAKGAGKKRTLETLIQVIFLPLCNFE